MPVHASCFKLGKPCHAWPSQIAFEAQEGEWLNNLRHGSGVPSLPVFAQKCLDLISPCCDQVLHAHAFTYDGDFQLDKRKQPTQSLCNNRR